MMTVLVGRATLLLEQDDAFGDYPAIKDLSQNVRPISAARLPRTRPTGAD